VFVNAQEKTPETQDLVTTKSSVQVGGKTINYTATTGYMPIKGADDKHVGNMFFVAYIKDGETNTKQRPVTYVFNGGPGSASVWLHIGALGPKRLKMAEDGNAIPAPYKLVNNDQTWLDLTDLVFIDPIGTGFSKAVEGEKAGQFYGFKNDISSVSQFIRLWTVKNERWGSPKYLAGESYGTTRACGVADYLMEEYGMYLNGITLISSALDFQTLRENEGNDLPYITNLPVYTATSQYHNVLSDKANVDTSIVSKAEQFAINRYSVALLKGDLLSIKEKSGIAQELSYYTGISVDEFLKNNLRIPTWKYRKLVLDKSDLLVGRYDSRMTMSDPSKGRDYATEDPSFTQISGAFATAFNEYVQAELDYTNESTFHVIGNVRPWKFEDDKYLTVAPHLRNAMFVNPHMKVWLANGKYDLATSYFGTEYTINHLNLTPELSKNLSFTYYNAGHMMYLLESELVQLKKDAVEFYK